MRKFSSKYRKGIWNSRAKSHPSFNHKLGTYFGRGIKAKASRMWSRGKYTTRQIFKKRYNSTKFSKWLSKYKQT